MAYGKTVRRRPKRSAMRSRKRAPSGRYGSQGPYQRFRGQGGYFGDAWNSIKKGAGYVSRAIPAGTFSKMGGTLGGAAGASYYGPGGVAPGSALGSVAGNVLSKLVGFGAYDIKSNTLIPVPEGTAVPHFGNLEQATIVSHREFIQDITAVGSTAFTNISFPVNPGMAGTFPWLAGISRGYSQYRFLGLVFEFKSTSSDITAGGALGSVILGTEYDVSDASYSNKLQMENAQYCTSDRPSHDILHPVECDPRLQSLDVFDIRSSDVPSGKDARFYDVANFQLATVGLPTSTGNIGELWVSYEIALFKPILATAINATDDFALPTTIATTNYLGADTTTELSPSDNSNLGGKCIKSTYFFPPTITNGNYLLTYSAGGASTNLATQMLVQVGVNCVGCAIYDGNTVPNLNMAAAAISDRVITSLAVTVTGANATVVFAAGTLPASITSGNLIVSPLAIALP